MFFLLHRNICGFCREGKLSERQFCGEKCLVECGVRGQTGPQCAEWPLNDATDVLISVKPQVSCFIICCCSLNVTKQKFLKVKESHLVSRTTRLTASGVAPCWITLPGSCTEFLSPPRGEMCVNIPPRFKLLFFFPPSRSFPTVRVQEGLRKRARRGPA